ncbi:MAG: aminopeptidase P family protein, partial [Clostridia bacterium]|nr:aminopeptidase P family protein [Clostridia bacterium]
YEDGFLIIIDDKKYIFADKRYFDAIKSSNAYVKTLLCSDTQIIDFLKEQGVKKVGLLYEYSSVYLSDLLIRNGFEIYNFDSEYSSLSQIKSSKEIALIENSCKVCEKSFFQAISHVKQGITELELSAILEYYFKKNGASSTSFDTIVAFGEGGAIPHYKTSNVTLKPNTPILMDFGCIVDGYASDMTRSFYFGTPSNEYVNVYDVVLKAHESASKSIKSGMTGKQADAFARDIIVANGYGDKFTHGLGHGIGVKVHENPRLSYKSDSVLQNGNVFSIEPGIYLEGAFGIRIEDTYCLVGDKCKSLMTSDKKLMTL